MEDGVHHSLFKKKEPLKRSSVKIFTTAEQSSIKSNINVLRITFYNLTYTNIQ